MDIDAIAISQIVRSVQMTYVQNANVEILDMTHYIMKHKEHEAQRASFNQRQLYWKNYYEQMDQMVQQSKRND